MEKVNYLYLCKAIADLSVLPVRLYEGTELIYSYSVVSLPADPIKPFLKEVLPICDHVGYFVTPRFFTYGVLNAGGKKIVVGPTAQVIPTDQTLRELAFQSDVPKEEAQQFLDGVKSLTRMPLGTLLTMLCAVNHGKLSGQNDLHRVG